MLKLTTSKPSIKMYTQHQIQIIEKKVFTIAKPIELGLVFEGEDAKEFFRNEKNPVVSKKLVGMFKRAKKINEKNSF